MTLVKINALSIPPQAGDQIVGRFQARMEEMSTVAGFEGFELLKPTSDEETRWFVYTRWADEESFQAWRNSETFANSHKAGPPPQGGSDGAEAAAPSEGDEAPKRPVATGSALLEFEVAVSAGPAQA